MNNKHRFKELLSTEFIDGLIKNNDFLSSLYLLNCVLNHATNLIQSRCKDILNNYN
jgi:hypothetical protein